jgi:hypothetical protein
MIGGLVYHADLWDEFIVYAQRGDESDGVRADGAIYRDILASQDIEYITKEIERL